MQGTMVIVLEKTRGPWKPKDAHAVRTGCDIPAKWSKEHPARMVVRKGPTARPFAEVLGHADFTVKEVPLDRQWID